MTAQILSRNNVTVRGDGRRTMLFAHGFGCDQNMWRYVAPAFERDFMVVLFDYVGCGRSDLGCFDPARYASLGGYAQDVLEICAALDLRDVIFVGHSVSAMIGALAAISEPARFASLILVAPSPCYVNHPPDYLGGFERADLEGLLAMMEHNYIGWAGHLAPLVTAHPERPELSAELHQSFCSTDPTTARHFAAVTFFADNRADLPRVPVPALILQCSDDALAPGAVGEYLHAHLPHSDLRVMRATGHCPHMSDPEETIALIRGYLHSFQPA